jgi:hypothetical protein
VKPAVPERELASQDRDIGFEARRSRLGGGDVVTAIVCCDASSLIQALVIDGAVNFHAKVQRSLGGAENAAARHPGERDDTSRAAPCVDARSRKTETHDAKAATRRMILERLEN